MVGIDSWQEHVKLRVDPLEALFRQFLWGFCVPPCLRATREPAEMRNSTNKKCFGQNCRKPQHEGLPEAWKRYNITPSVHDTKHVVPDGTPWENPTRSFRARKIGVVNKLSHRVARRQPSQNTVAIEASPNQESSSWLATILYLLVPVLLAETFLFR